MVKVEVTGSRLDKSSIRLNRFDANKFGKVKALFTTKDKTIRVLFGLAFVPFFGRWYGIGVSFIPVLDVKVVEK